MSTANHPSPATADREIVITRLIDAPRALVYSVWTEAKHIAKWWGPNGFTTSTSKMEFKPGGKWVFTMHGPDGTDYANWIRYNEIVPNERLEYSHGGAEDAPAEFEQTVTFSEEGGKTRVTLHLLLPTREARDHAVKEIGAVEGGEQTLGRLDAYVHTLNG